MLYRVLHLVANIALRLFYRSIRLTGEAREEQAPLVIVANHFNGLMDALLIAAHYKRRCMFVGKSTLPLFWPGIRLLTKRFCLPVYRVQDGQDTKKNEDTFDQAIKVLEGGGCIIIFPPRRYMEARWIPEFATGFARMVFAAEARHDFKLGCKVQPVGLNFSRLGVDTGSVTVVFGEALEIGTSEWQAKYAQDQRKAGRELAALMERRVKMITAEVHDDKRQLVENISRVYELTTPDNLERMDRISKAVEKLTQIDPGSLEEIAPRVEAYIRRAERLRIPVGQEMVLKWNWLWTLVAPLVVLGTALYALPYWFVRIAAKLIPLNPYFQQTVAFVLALLVFPAWFLILGGGLFLVFPLGPALLLWLALLAAGVAVRKFGPAGYAYTLRLIPYLGRRRLRELKEEGLQLRAELIALAEKAEAN